MSLEKCPWSFCGKTVDQDAAKKEIERLLSACGNWGQHCNPGGREFNFSDGSRLQIGDNCYHCDLKTVQEFAAKRGVI